MSQIATRKVPCPACGSPRKVEQIVPESLRAVRLAAGIGLRELGGLVGLSAAYLSDVERGKRGATDRVLEIYRGLEAATTTPGGDGSAGQNREGA